MSKIAVYRCDNKDCDFYKKQYEVDAPNGKLNADASRCGQCGRRATKIPDYKVDTAHGVEVV